MAYKLVDSGDATKGNEFWTPSGTVTSATDFVRAGHVASIKLGLNGTNLLTSATGVVQDAGARVNLWVYLVALPTTGNRVLLAIRTAAANCFFVGLSTTGVLQILNASGTQIGSNGATLPIGQGYQIQLAYTIASTTVNEFRLYVRDDAGNILTGISATNGTLTITGTSVIRLQHGADPTQDERFNDVWVDDSSTLTYAGDIRGSAKRPFSNGTTNGFSTNGSASGYGSGNAGYVNERPINQSNFLSKIGAGAAVTEEFNLEGIAVGDLDLSSGKIQDVLYWLQAKSLASETAQIVYNGATASISLTSTITLFQKMAGAAAYPAGVGTDVGIITGTDLTTVSVYEMGAIILYIPFMPQEDPGRAPRFREEELETLVPIGG